jgi:hypothetical protein
MKTARKTTYAPARIAGRGGSDLVEAKRRAINATAAGAPATQIGTADCHLFPVANPGALTTLHLYAN